jgi:hypothetical protein
MRRTHGLTAAVLAHNPEMRLLALQTAIFSHDRGDRRGCPFAVG